MRTLSLIALIVALGIPIAACGDDDESNGGGSASGGTTTKEDMGGGYSKTGSDTTGGGGGGQTLKLAADPGGAPKFDKTSLSAKPGKVTIVMDNPSDVPHAVEIEGKGVEVAGDTVTKGGVSKASADLKPGDYEFYCPVDGHRAAGMEGKLTVK